MRSLAHCSSSARLFPSSVLAKPHCGLSARNSSGAYFDASPISYAVRANNKVAVFLSWGTEDDLVNIHQQSEAFMLALKQAGHFVRPVIVEGAPHFWVWEPVDEPGTSNNFLAPRLLRFLEQRL